LSLTRPQNHLWRDATTQHLQRAQTEENARTRWIAAGTGVHTMGRTCLQRAEKDTAVWRALMFMGRPSRWTLVLLVILAMVYLAGDVFLSGELQEKFLLWAGNSSATIQQGEWWRVFTALFLHANWLHLTMNGAGFVDFWDGGGENDGRWALARWCSCWPAPSAIWPARSWHTTTWPSARAAESLA